MLKPLHFITLIICLFSLSISAQARTVRYNNDLSEKEQYYVQLLKLALEKSGSGIVSEPADQLLAEAKLMAEVQAGSRDIYWGGATKENESKMAPIRIPLAKGLLGYRLFIIKKGEQHKFNSVNNLSDLKRLIAGQGKFWGDTPILANAGLPLETPVKYQSLFHMLEGERFDYFPRAAHEPWSEVKAYSELELTVEKNLMLVYPLAMYYYVNKSDVELANAIEAGLEKAIADGSFDNFFYNNPLIKSVMQEANIKQRKVIKIDNPYLPEETQLDRPELWLDIASIP